MKKTSHVLRVAAYCRVSTDAADQANSFESQKHYFQTCIERHPEWVLQEIYADEGLSGTSTEKRERFQEMIRAARDGQIDLIITKEVSRFARNTVDTLAYTRELRRQNVGVYFLLDNIHTLDADGELRLSIMATLAQEESRKTSQRVKWGQKERMKQGIVFGRSLLGYDVQNGIIKVNPEGAAIVQRIYRMYLQEGMGTGAIARVLQTEGIPTSRGNLQWSATTVRKILRNEKYCGDLIQKKTYTPDYLTHKKRQNTGQEEIIVLRDHHEPIIERSQWEQVQRELQRRSKNRQGGAGRRYPFSGKIYCAECGAAFVCRTKTDGAGQTYHVWRCGTACTHGTVGVGGCSIGRQLRNEVVCTLISHCIQMVPLDYREMESRLCRLVGHVTKSTESRDMETVETLLQKQQRTLEGYLSHTISESEYRFLYDRYQKQLDEIRLQTESQSDICNQIQEAIKEEPDDDLLGSLLQRMEVHQDGTVSVELTGLQACWIYRDRHIPAKT